jgi:hypothetical protein
MTSTYSSTDVLPDLRGRLNAVAGGLYERVAATGPDEYERDSSPVLDALKETRATVMLVPRRFGGGGHGAVDAVLFQTALGALAPSAAIGTTMHHYKIAALADVAVTGDARAGAILEDIARGAKLVASGGAESTPGRDLRSLGSRAVRDGDGYRVSGLKRPCSLSGSMDIMSLMVEIQSADGVPEGYAQAFLDADAEGLRVEAFWHSSVFRAAQSHAVRLDGVRLPAERLFPLREQDGRRFAAGCYTWFQLLISAAYLGVAYCVALAADPRGRAGSPAWTSAVAQLRRLEDGVLDAARAIDGQADEGTRLNMSVRARDRLEDELAAVGGRLLRAAGGAGFAREGLPTALTGALNAIAFHPPRRGAREGVGLELLDPELKDVP